IEEEMRKLFLRGKPKAILRALRNAREDGIIDALFPELARLGSIQQDNRYHAEGDALEHTFRVVAEAARLAEKYQMNANLSWVLALAALIHDLGKSVTTEIKNDGSIISHGHDKAGQVSGESLLHRITGQVKVIEQSLALARVHMRPLQLAQAGKVTDGAIRRLAQAVHPSSIEMLCKLTEADTRGSIRGDGSQPENAHDFLRKRAKTLGVQIRPARPIIQGRDLMKLAKKGILPENFKRGGPHFGPILDKLYEAQLDGIITSGTEAHEFLKKLDIEEML
ncbi:HD domain-containing protein, partial [bacterium]|nr:HD domain-containing protein [bacterium]